MFPHLKGGIFNQTRMLPTTVVGTFKQISTILSTEGNRFKQTSMLQSAEGMRFKQTWLLLSAEGSMFKQIWSFPHLPKALVLLVFEPFFAFEIFSSKKIISGERINFFINYPGIFLNGITPGTKT